MTRFRPPIIKSTMESLESKFDTTRGLTELNLRLYPPGHNLNFKLKLKGVAD
jgi:hypothetical protein